MWVGRHELEHRGPRRTESSEQLELLQVGDELDGLDGDVPVDVTDHLTEALLEASREVHEAREVAVRRTIDGVERGEREAAHLRRFEIVEDPAEVLEVRVSKKRRTLRESLQMPQGGRGVTMGLVW